MRLFDATPVNKFPENLSSRLMRSVNSHSGWELPGEKPVPPKVQQWGRVVCAQILDKSTVSVSTGLASDEVSKLLAQFGPNSVPDTSVHLLRRMLSKFWAPVPWMLEAAVATQMALGKYVEGGIIAGLLIIFFDAC